jgi:hypothetical protein
MKVFAAALLALLVGCSTGTVGPEGPVGPKGDTGPAGAKGDTGAQGLKGETGAAGAKGDTGAQGLKGETGAAGLKGDSGAQGLKGDTGARGPAGLTWRGAWAEGTAYLVNDAVQSAGAAYVATATSTGSAPPGAAWTLLAASGAAGADVTGASLDVGDTHCPAGGVKYTSVSGDAFVCNGYDGLKGDKGDKGDTGAQGLKGDTGAQGTQGLKGDTGSQGPKGDTGAAGTPATVANVSCGAGNLLQGFDSQGAPVCVPFSTFTTTAQAATLSASLVPVGTVVPSMLTEAQFNATVPNGALWALADGRSVTGSKYAAATGASVLPDLRGQFLRGKNGARSDGKQNPDGDVALGTYQADAFASHTHSASFGSVILMNAGTSYGTYIQSGSSNTSAAGGNESRGKNVTVNYFVKID